MTMTNQWDAGRHRPISRRSLLTALGGAILVLGGCGDGPTDRRFVGDREPDENTPTEPERTISSESGSPAAVVTALPITDLLQPRGDHTIALAVRPQTVVAIDVEQTSGHVIWEDDQRRVWAGEIDRSSSRVALLTSRRDSATQWAVEFIVLPEDDRDIVQIGEWQEEDRGAPDAVADGLGGIAWLPDSSSVAVAMPTGGMLQVFPDGSQVKLAKAAIAKRPASVDISPDGSTIAFVEQPARGEGSGILAGSMKAKPVDPIVVLPADRSGNRSARGVAWLGNTDRVATIIERTELGLAQGDLFYLDTQSKVLEVAWTSSGGRDIASVTSFAIAPDVSVMAFLTNPMFANGRKPGSLWLKQIDGPTIERFDLPIPLSLARLIFTTRGLVVTGSAANDSEGRLFGFLLALNGEIVPLYEQEPIATPLASPIASPIASPMTSPVAVDLPAASSSPGSPTRAG